MSLSKQTITKHDMNNILFSGQKKKIKKIDKWILICFSIYTFAILTMMYFVSKGNVPGELIFGIGVVFASSFLYIGYSWMNASPFNVKKERKWFIFMAAFGSVLPFLKFVSDGLPTPYAIFALMPMLLVIALLCREISNIKFKKKTTSNFIARNVNIFLYSWSIVVFLFMFLFISKMIPIAQGTYVLIGIIVAIELTIMGLRFFYRNKNRYGSIINASSVNTIIPLACLIGIFGWMILVFAMSFGIGPIVASVAGVQVVLLIIMTVVVLKGKEEFEISFVKSFTINVSILLEAILSIAVKSVATNENGGFLNAILFVLSVIVFNLIIYIKGIQRNRRFGLLEVGALNALIAALIGMTVLQSTGALDSMSKNVDIQSALIAMMLVFVFANIIFATIEWRRSLNFVKKEKEWK